MSQCCHKDLQHKNFQKSGSGVLTIFGEIYNFIFMVFLENFQRIVLEKRVRHNYVDLCTKLLKVSSYMLLVYNVCPQQTLAINMTKNHQTAIMCRAL